LANSDQETQNRQITSRELDCILLITLNFNGAQEILHRKTVETGTNPTTAWTLQNRPYCPRAVIPTASVDIDFGLANHALWGGI
jgi:hypothetical protein